MLQCLLNNIQKEGMLTYTDFVFLNILLATPKRYINMIFHAFDISADGKINFKVSYKTGLYGLKLFWDDPLKDKIRNIFTLFKSRRLDNGQWTCI